MKHSKSTCARVLSASVLTALLASNASALTINLNDVGSTPMTAAQLAAFTQAANDWENTCNNINYYFTQHL